MENVKPPLGIPPKDVVEHHFNVFRIGEILGGMSRFAEAGKPIPVEWVKELSERIGEYMKEVDE